MGAGRELAHQVARELVGEDGAEHRHPDRAADLAEEGRARAGDAEVLVVDGVLGGKDEHLNDEPEAEPEHEHVGARDHGRGVDL